MRANPPMQTSRWSLGSLVLMVVLGFSCSLPAQQVPSQRYLPVRKSPYQSQQAKTPQRSPQIIDAKRLPSAYDRANRAAAPAPSIPTQSQYYPEMNQRGMVQLASHQEPVVPEILGKPEKQVLPSGKTMSEYAKSLGINSTPMNSGLDKLRQDTTNKSQAAPKSAPNQNSSVPVYNPPVVKSFGDASKPVAPATRMNPIEPMASRISATQMAANRMQAEQKASQASANLATPRDSSVSATQFVAEINQQKNIQERDQTPFKAATPRMTATHGNQTVSPAMELANESSIKQASANQENQLQPAPMRKVKDAVVQLPAPSISVITRGPETIGINKPAEYQVIVRNNSVIDAERILVGVDLPNWIDLQNVTQTAGGKEVTDGKGQARLVWSVDRIQGNSQQVMTITAIPRKAEVFDVGVEWTLVPRTGKANIRVTEPKLEMSISGPKDVLYGETASYHVSVRNPGTGVAERVVVMLPETLGGERQTLGDIPAGKERNFQIELLARTAGELKLVTRATADGNLQTSAERALTVRRAKLQISMNGPKIRYSGDVGKYTVKLTNVGDAPATELMTAVALPPGVKYLDGIESVKLIEGGMRWPVGSLAPGQSREYHMHCQLDTSGEVQLEVGAQGKGDLAAAGAFKTTVDTTADLVLSVTDLKGPLPTGKEVPYTIKIKNRGTKAAQNVSLVMQFSKGVEPRNAKGLGHQIKTGQVHFAPIAQIDPGQEVTVVVTATAMQSGTHIFRAQLNSEQSDVHEIAEGTTRFYGDTIQPPAISTANGNSFESGIK